MSNKALLLLLFPLVLPLHYSEGIVNNGNILRKQIKDEQEKSKNEIQTVSVLIVLF